MARIADNPGAGLPGVNQASVESRIFRTMWAVIAIAVLISLFFASRRVSAGLAFGGGLALLNYHWLRTSMAAVFQNVAPQARPRIGLLKYVLRYFVIAAAVAVVYKLEVVSLIATIAGLSAFVVAFVFEAMRQSYFAFLGREESF